MRNRESHRPRLGKKRWLAIWTVILGVVLLFAVVFGSTGSRADTAEGNLREIGASVNRIGGHLVDTVGEMFRDPLDR